MGNTVVAPDDEAIREWGGASVREQLTIVTDNPRRSIAEIVVIDFSSSVVLEHTAEPEPPTKDVRKIHERIRISFDSAYILPTVLLYAVGVVGALLVAWLLNISVALALATAIGISSGAVILVEGSRAKHGSIATLTLYTTAFLLLAELIILLRR